MSLNSGIDRMELFVFYLIKTTKETEAPALNESTTTNGAAQALQLHKEKKTKKKKEEKNI